MSRVAPVSGLGSGEGCGGGVLLVTHQQSTGHAEDERTTPNDCVLAPRRRALHCEVARGAGMSATIHPELALLQARMSMDGNDKTFE